MLRDLRSALNAPPLWWPRVGAGSMGEWARAFNVATGKRDLRAPRAIVGARLRDPAGLIRPRQKTQDARPGSLGGPARAEPSGECVELGQRPLAHGAVPEQVGRLGGDRRHIRP